MGQPKLIKVSNQVETVVQTMQSKSFAYRYAYARSNDSQKEEEPGQDILVFLEGGTRMAFALCDGVNQFFFGDLATQALADVLVEWLLKIKKIDAASLPFTLASIFKKQTFLTNKIVEKYPLPTEISAMFRPGSISGE